MSELLPESADKTISTNGATDLAEDTSAIDDFAELATQKVQLDIEDASFLNDEPESEVQESVDADDKEVPKSASAPEAEASFFSRRKFALITGAICVCIISILWYVYFKPIPDFSLVKPAPTVILVPSPPSSPAYEEFVVSFAPFVIEKRDANQVRFLETRFAVVVTNENMKLDIIEKKTILRDAIYYYLFNQDIKFLLNSQNITSIKNNLEDIINSYLGQEKIKDLLVEQYFIR